jgi:3-oxoacyl-(acyl-carrier-protein) synthase
VTDPRKTIVVTGIGVVSPYGVGVDCLQAGVLSGKCCLAPTKDLYPGFVGSTAQVSGLPALQNELGARYSRSDRLAMVAARDAVWNLDHESTALRSSGVFMASTVAGLSEIDPEIA